MTILTSSQTFSIGAAATVVEAADVLILPVAGAGEGRGRLIHPTLGTYDYRYAPNEWSGIDGDLIVPPIWATTKTLEGSANTLWQGHIRDVVVEERWVNQLSLPLEQLRTFIAFWMNPPDPASAYVQWWPQYTSDQGFSVILLAVDVGGQGVNLNFVTRQDWCASPVTLRMRIVERL